MKKSNDIEAWGRHFDVLLWTVTTIMATAIGGLLVYSYSHDHFNPWLASFGFILTIIAVYFAASFRQLRNRAKDKYPEEIKSIINEKRLYQWWAYLLIFIILELLWIKLFIDKRPDLPCFWFIVFGSIGIGFMIYCGCKSS